MSATVKVEQDGPIALVWLARPKAYNAFDLEMVSALADRLITLAGDDGVRAVVLAGQGQAFCAGGDLKWVAGGAKGPGAAFHELAARFHQAILEIRRMPKPVIAALNGAAAGGGFSLALACDFRVMAESAVLRQAYTSNGLCPDGGGTFFLPRLAGLARALEIVAFDRPIPAAKALEWGLCTKVVPDANLLDEAVGLARELAGRSRHALAWAKQLLTDSFDTSLETHLERERYGLSVCGEHQDGREGLAAFGEKRKPVFSSR
ncbi:MAG: enoyl-CoA hydratase-related protein [Pseudomonadota bacterium]